VTAPSDAHGNENQKDRLHDEALLGSRTHAHYTARTFQLAGQFEENVEGGDPKPSNRQRQGQEVQHVSMAWARQEADPQDGDHAHDEGALVQAERTRLETHAHAQPQAASQGEEGEQKWRPNQMQGVVA